RQTGVTTYAPPEASPKAPTVSPAVTVSTPSTTTASAPLTTVTTPSASAPVPNPAPAPTHAPGSPTSSSTPTPQEPTAASAIPGGKGVIQTSGLAPGRRVFVDRRVLGETPNPITLPCGQHTVQIGSNGKLQTLDVPCGGEVSASEH